MRTRIRSSNDWRRFNTQLVNAEKERIDAESKYTSAKGAGRADALVEADEQRLGALEARLQELQQKRTLLLVDATEEAPEVRELDPQIGELRNQIKDLRDARVPFF